MLKTILLLFLFTPNLFSQDLPLLSLHSTEVVFADSVSSDRYVALYLSSGILAFEDHKGLNAKLLLTADASVQFTDWFYIDLKLETYNHSDARNAVIISLMPAFGLQLFNDRSFLLMSGLGFSIIGVKGGHGLGSMYSAFSRLRYGITNVFGVFSEVRYGLAIEGSNNHNFFLNLGISLQAPLKTPSF